MDEFLYILKIPKERIAVLIGHKGKLKRQLQKLTNTKIEVNSKEGEVTIKGEDALNLYSIREVIKAIGRGFNPEIAKQLLTQDQTCEYLNISDYVRSKEQIGRLRGRVIGTEGKSRTTLEKLTNTSICIYGKTIAIIGHSEDTLRAKRAIEAILKGAPHSHAYHLLEKRNKYKLEG